jgi:hypothetical protein
MNLPEPYLSAEVTASLLGPNVREPLYTADQLREAVAAERERCALICDVTPPYPFRPSIEAAHAIRQAPAE